MEIKDLVVVGGGINGAGIAADAAGRGLSVILCEAQDLACATSSASSKLIHGGLRYLEHYEFRLVSEALAEREVLLKKAPHIIFPLRFRLPYQPHLRPAWMIRIGLFLYDHLGKRTQLPASQSLRFNAQSAVKADISKGFEYSDCWADDARLVVLNAQQAMANGAQILTRTQVIRAVRNQGLWDIEALDSRTGEKKYWRARGLVNATGPWVRDFFDHHLQLPAKYGVRMIKGSHIVVPKVHNESQAYILQNKDNRIVFVIPWLEEFSIIGTTDVEYHGDPRQVTMDEQEKNYLLAIYNQYFKKQLSSEDIVWSYSGVRPLCDDESDSPSAITRDYTLEIDDEQGKAPLLSVFGGKLTTYRKLAEHALEKLAAYYPNCGPAWTKESLLPGGDIVGDRQQYADHLQQRYPFLPQPLAWHLARTYGSHSEKILQLYTPTPSQLTDLGQHFGHHLYEAELLYLVAYEWAYELDDVIWRRTKWGMWLDQEQQQAVQSWLLAQRDKVAAQRI